MNFDERQEVCVARIDGVDDDEEHEGLDDPEAQEEEFGSRNTVHTHDPRQPSEQKRIEHEMTHLPCRSWCGHCIKGRGRVDLPENGRGEMTCPRDTAGPNGKREGRKNAGVLGHM